MKTRIGAIVVGALLLIGLILLMMSITVVPQGHAGVVYNRAHGVEEKALPQGWKIVGPTERVTDYPISTETVKVKKFNVQTKDGKPLKVSMSYDYMNELEKLPYIYNKFKGQEPDVIEAGWLQTRIKKAALNTFSKYSVLEVFQNQGKINGEIETAFRKAIAEHGFVIDSVTLGAPTPDAATAKAIQAVVDAQQQLKALEIEKEKAIVTADKAKIEAEGKANAAIEIARGNAESVRMAAAATAEANKKIAASLTPEVLKYEEMKARQKHGWVEIQGVSNAIVDTKK